MCCNFQNTKEKKEHLPKLDETNIWEEKFAFTHKTFTFPQETVCSLTLLPITFVMQNAKAFSTKALKYNSSISYFFHHNIPLGLCRFMMSDTQNINMTAKIYTLTAASTGCAEIVLPNYDEVIKTNSKDTFNLK